MDGTVSDGPFTSRDPTLKFKVNDDFQKVEKRYDFPARMSEKSRIWNVAVKWNCLSFIFSLMPYEAVL